MIIIADSNIFMSALISPQGLIASVLAERKKIQYIVPDYLIEEVTEIIQEKDLKKTYVSKAQKIVADVDENDMHFIALHLQIKHKIWTSDKVLVKGLTEKGYGHFFTSTEELSQHLYKK